MRDVRGEVADAVCEAWRSVLRLPDAAAGPDFFAAGGTSFSAVVMMEQVESALGIVFPLETLFLDGGLDAVLKECDARYKAAAAEGGSA